jgi:localization factor PodJL
MKRSADQGLAVAQRTLGSWYEQGDGVTKDLAQARGWYERAAQNGDVQAMHNLGFFYAQGMGGLNRDGTAAVRWFKSAAERGLVASEVNLAIIYSQAASYGLPVQNDQAYFWSAVAAKRDPSDKDAPRMRDALGASLPADAKAQIDQQVADWKPTPVDVAANGGFDSSPEAFLPADRQPSLSHEELVTVQQELDNLGFDAGTADGRPGLQTEAAIKAFQAQYGLTQTGMANRDLLAALSAIPH